VLGNRVLNRESLFAAIALAASAVSPAFAQGSLSDKNVLALYSYAREFPTDTFYERGLRRTLATPPQGGPDYYSEYLEIDRFPEEEQSPLLRDYLRKKYANRRIDVIVATAHTPFEFLLDDRSLFPGVPIVYTALGPVDSTSEGSLPGVASVVIVGAYAKTLEAMRAIHPDAERVFVVTSLPKNDGKGREDIIRRELASFEHQLTITYLTDMTTEALVQRISQAPPRSLVLYVRHAEEDSAGTGLDPVEAASVLVRASAVPVYSIERTYFGQGVVGGYLVDHEVLGAQAGDLSLRILAGARPQDLDATSATLMPMFDWRALQRWGIDRDRLPAGSDIRFRAPTAWDQYRGYIVGAATLLAIQTLTIAALVVQRSRRRKVEARNAAFLSAAPDMMFLLTKQGVFLDYHAPDRRDLFVEPDSFIGRRVSDVLPPRVAATVADSVSRLEKEPGPVIVEYALPMPDGDHQYEGRVVPCRDNEVLVVVRDVTQRKRSERALTDAQANLLRLSRLTALGEFTASIAHEIRQPLTVILLNARTCLRWLSGRTPDLTEISAALTDVVEAGQRANEIIRRNRELFKHGTVQKAPLDLNAVISEVEALAQSRLSAARVTLVTSVPPDIPAVQGDRVELQQVLLNLIGNSIEAMDGAESSARRIEISSDLSPQGHVRVSVRDTGVGLDGVDRARMFDLSYTTKPSGSGVGLSISRSIIEAHGGQLWAEESPGRGATFVFTLPVHSTASVT
jgi:signal transduction histidine kinase